MATKTDGTDQVEVIDLPRPGKKRRFTAPEKKRLLEEAQAPGASVSSVARRYGISPSLLFRWRRLNDEGGLQGLGAEEAVVPESEVKQDDCVFDAAGAGAGEDAGVEAVGANWIRGVGRKNFDLDVVRRVFEMELSHATAADDQFG